MASREQETQEKTKEKLKASGLSKREQLAFSNLFRKMYNAFCRPCQLHYVNTVASRDDALASVDVEEWSKGLCQDCRVKFDVKFLPRLKRFSK